MDSPKNQPHSPTGLHDDMGWLATSCGIASAIGYMLANVCLRSVTQLDPIWVSTMKTLPTVVVTAPFLFMRLLGRQPIIPSFRILVLVVLVAILGQVAGNVAFQWSLGVVGIALTVPITLGTMIVSGGVLGRMILKERVSRPMAVSSIVLIVAICVLSTGASQANESIDHLPSPADSVDLVRVILGVTCACVAGVAYSCLSVTLRLASNRGTPISSLLFIVGLTGLVLLSSWVQIRHGQLPWDTLHGRTLAYLVGAGTFNLIAFAALAKALHLSSVVFVNALNASQTAMAAVVGVFMFGEAFSLPMLTGVLLTIVGLLIMRGRPRPRNSPPTTAPRLTAEVPARSSSG